MRVCNHILYPCEDVSAPAFSFGSLGVLLGEGCADGQGCKVMMECEAGWAVLWGSGGEWDQETEGMVGRGGWGERRGRAWGGLRVGAAWVEKWEGRQGVHWGPPVGALTLPSPSPNRRVLGRPQPGLCSGCLPGFLQLYSRRGNMCDAPG